MDFDDSWDGGYPKPRFEVKWYHHIGDFANLFKAFIGTNYLTLAYGLKQSGLGAGLFMFVVIAALTDHCCGLIVTCKHLLIDDLCCKAIYKRRCSGSGKDESTESPSENVALLRRRLMRSLHYADIGKLTWGKYGSFMVYLFLVITQMGFCVNYYIFIGNTLYGMFPMESTASLNSSLIGSGEVQSVKDNIGSIAQDGKSVSLLAEMNATIIPPSQEVINTDDIATLLPPLLTISYTAGNGTNSSDIIAEHSTAPALELLVLAPMPIFILFTLFRNIRQMSLVSVIANVSCLVGFFSVVIYILADFHVQTVTWLRLATLPILIGQLTASYEAIGTIIPIESSMEGSHHYFPACLHGVVLFFSAMITASSVIGYLNYGEDTKQIITQNLPAGEITVIVINTTLLLGILCTYPLQIYPVIEILEFHLFTKGKLFGPSATLTPSSGNDDESHPLLTSSSVEKADLGLSHSVALEVPTQVPAWKRNLLRTVITILIGGFAVVFRNVFAYFNALIGAIGSAPLAFVLPCLLHFTIVRQTAPVSVLIKDICIAVIGIAFGLTGLFISIQQMIIKI